jgi:histidinol phosphatase-like enzyme
MTKSNTTFNKKKYCFDLDGVICKTYMSSYKKSKPILKAIKKINLLYSEGNEIIIFTARFMGRNKDNVYLAKKQGYHFTLKQLTKWKVKFHKLIFGKPSYDFIIDDKAVVFKNWVTNIK